LIELLIVDLQIVAWELERALNQQSRIDNQQRIGNRESTISNNAG